MDFEFSLNPRYIVPIFIKRKISVKDEVIVKMKLVLNSLK